MEQPNTVQKRRFRFSLLNLLLMTAIVALALTVVGLWSDIGPIKKENRRLRNELGFLTVSDKSLTHAIQLNTDNELHWKWRVWIPQGKKYWVRCSKEWMPKESFPDRGGKIEVYKPGEITVEYRIQKDPLDDRWMGKLSVSHSDSSSGVGSYPHPWVGDKSFTTRRVSGVGTATSVFEIDQPINLIRYQVQKEMNLPDTQPEGTGFMVWLDTK